MTDADPEAILEFWFGDDLESPEAVAARSLLWFQSDPSFDARIRERFGSLPSRARRGELDPWQGEPRSCLALVLVLDQFPRNLHRGYAEAYAYDPLARQVAIQALGRGFDGELAPVEARFLVLPLEHAEDVELQARGVALLQRLVDRAPSGLSPQFELFISYAVRHQQVIERFGRFPHRNAVLGRPCTPEEKAYLEAGGETFGG